MKAVKQSKSKFKHLNNDPYQVLFLLVSVFQKIHIGLSTKVVDELMKMVKERRKIRKTASVVYDSYYVSLVLVSTTYHCSYLLAHVEAHLSRSN